MATQFPVGSRRIRGAGSGTSATRDVRSQMRSVEKNLQQAIAAIKNATVEGIEAGLQPIFDESQRLVPVDSGVLKASGFIDVEIRASGVSAVVGYARGSKPPYAAIVHERLDVAHAAPTQAKFLEAAVMRNLAGFEDRIKNAMRGALGINS